MYSFIHTSDWHLGKPFGQFEDDLRGRLREARHSIIDRVASLAHGRNARLILVAGDVWDSREPSAAVLRQSLDAMASHETLTWALLPGNHDLAREGGVWERLASGADKPGNIHLLLAEQPHEVERGIFLLPAPCRVTNPGRDLTAWMDAADSPKGAVRVGVAHGSIRDFSSERPHSSVINPNRVETASLDYLALGDWHGAVKVNDRCWYSGTPEPDRFRKNESGNCLLVRIEAAKATPSVEPIETKQFAWADPIIDLLPGLTPEDHLPGCLPEGTAPRDTLLNLRLVGRSTLAERSRWDRALDDLEPSLAYLDRDFSGLEILYEAENLDQIDQAGALRAAAEALRKEAADPGLSETRQAVARDALNRLYSWCTDEESAA